MSEAAALLKEGLDKINRACPHRSILIIPTFLISILELIAL
jgi:hypothetical protein